MKFPHSYLWRLLFSLLGAAFCLFLLHRLVLFSNDHFPYRPTVEEAVEYELAREGMIMYVSSLPLLQYSDIQVTHVVSEVPETQVVMITYTQVVDEGEGERMEHCYSVEYITRHWLTGPRAYSSMGGECRWAAVEALLPPLMMQSKLEKGTSVVGGMVGDDIGIQAVQARWHDGLITITPVISGTFLFFRADGVEVEWVEGLDEQGRVISDTLTHNRDVHFTPLDYTAFQQIILPAGVVVLGSYTLSGLQPQECLEVTYLTAENAVRFLQGKEAFTGQRACVIDPGAEVLAPIVSTIVEGDKVMSGRVLDERVTAVFLRWSDGWVETVPVLDGRFFFAQRPLPPGASLSTATIRGLDAEGNEVTR